MAALLSSVKTALQQAGIVYEVNPTELRKLPGVTMVENLAKPKDDA